MVPAELVNRQYQILYEDDKQIHLYHRLVANHMMTAELWKDTREYRRSLFWRPSTQLAIRTLVGIAAQRTPPLQDLQSATGSIHGVWLFCPMVGIKEGPQIWVEQVSGFFG